MSVNLCRLCLAKDNLLCIFDGSFENMDMKDIVYLATGIEFHINDSISQSICESCSFFTIKIFQFRTQCIKSEKYLKEKSKEYDKDKECVVQNIQTTIKNVVKRRSKKIEVKRLSQKINKCSNSIHPSVCELSKKYPQIKFPPLCLNSHISPVVSMEMNEVELYFKKRQLDINVYIKSALDSSRKAEKFVKSNQPNQITKTKKLFSMKTLIRPKKNGEPHVIESNSDMHTKVPIGSNTGKQSLNNGVDTSKIIKRSAKPPSKFNMMKQYENPTKTKSEVEKSMKTNINEKSVVNESVDFATITTEKSLNACDSPDYLPVQGSINANKTNELTLRKSLDLVPNTTVYPVNKDSCIDSLSYSEKSALHICNICNSAQYTSRRLRRHRMEHLRCQFCNDQFRSIQKKMYHVENQCSVKRSIPNAVSEIELEQIKSGIETCRKYSDAFVHFLSFETENSAAITGSDNVNDKVVEPAHAELSQTFETILNSNSSLAPKEQHLTVNTISPAESSGIIEILSDDEESQAASSANGINEPQGDRHSLITPRINIKNSSVLNNIDIMDSDENIMKKLLADLQPLKVFKLEHETDLPTNNDIIHLEKKVVLKNLKHLLFSYRIPVKMSVGSMHVSYDYNVDSRPPNNLHIWNDITPIDIKQVKNGSSTY